MTILVIAFTAVVFFAIVISLAAKPRFVRGFTCAALFIAGIGGLLLYGYGYSYVSENILLAIIRATLATCGMLLGKNDFSVISAAPFFQHSFGVCVFWLLHLLALYATASATITTVGAGLLQNIRIWLARRGDLVIIYGIQSGSIDFGRELLGRKNTSVVFVDEKPNAALVEQIRISGGVARFDPAAVAANGRFLKKLGIRPGNRHIWLYALSKEYAKNLHYAHALLKSFEKAQILPQQTGLVLMGMEAGAQTAFLAKEGRYGYGDLYVMDEAMMAARCLIHKYPPANTISFDTEGCAEEDLDCMILGFGKVGQAVLQQLVMNGQFCGSTFHAVILDPQYQQLTGRVMSQNSVMLDNYDIRFMDCDARSSQMFEYLDSHRKTLNYIVACTGSNKLNEEITFEILHHFECRGYSLPVYLCGYNGVQKMTLECLPENHKLYTVSNLWQNGLDQMAMSVNQTYCHSNGKSKEENWESCDYFSRMSSRAFADFIPSLIKIAGVTEKKLRSGEWKPDKTLLENLSITEHMRWCAFHYTMGYAPMDPETFHRRGKIHAKQREETGKGTLRIGKDTALRLHACLIPWEELDALSEAENRYTGGNVDYKVMDTNNVLAIPRILQAAKEAEG